MIGCNRLLTNNAVCTDFLKRLMSKISLGIQSDRGIVHKGDHEFHETCLSVTFYFMKFSFSDISRKWILPNMIRAGITLDLLLP